MKNLSELTDFYYKVLHKPLQELEKERKNLKQRIVMVGILFTIIALSLYSAFFSFDQFPNDGMMFFIFGYFALGSLIYKFLIKDYTKDFKERIIRPLINEIDVKLGYFPEQHISENLFKHARIVTSRIDRFSGNDYVSGQIDNINIKFSDVHAEKRHKDSKGRTSWSTLFQGLFIVADFHKHFHGSTVVLPDTAQNTFGDLIGNWLQSKNFSRNELVKMDNPDFEKEFVVYGSDQVEARYILSHTMMEKLLAFKKRSKHPLYISFIGRSIHMAIEYNKDLFEPSIFHSLLDFKVAMQYVQTLHLCIGVIEELNLNKKLWSKR